MGIPADNIERIGRLSDILARPYRAMKKPMVVSPLVFQQRQAFTPELNHEAEDYLWIPLRFFTDTRNRDSMTIEKAGLMHQLPCYHIDEKRIWGLSLMMIDELITALD
jgi:hypothetical protein